MARVSDRTKALIRNELSQMPAEALAKCSLCRETLTHIVKRIEAKAGAGTATVTKMLADIINKDALPQDQVTPEALTQRVRQKEGLKMSNRQNKHKSEPIEPDSAPEAEHHAELEAAKAHIAELIEAKASLEGLNAKLAEDNVSLLDQIEDWVKDIKALSLEHNKLSEKLAETECERNDLKADSDWLQKELKRVLEEKSRMSATGYMGGGEFDLGTDAGGKAAEFIKVAYREMSKRYHPDAGGTNKDMQELNMIVTAFRGVMGIR